MNKKNTKMSRTHSTHKTLLPTALARRLASLGLICLVGGTASAGIRFEDVTAAAGPFHTGSSWGAAWGDLNGDGRPDLYASNHQQRGALYRNNGDGTFTDILLSVDQPGVWIGEPLQDTHGATWGDFDNDGDLDLLSARSSEGGRLQLFVNSGGVFTEEKAKELGLADFPGGRLGIWFDYDNDGHLDVAAMGFGYAEIYQQRAGAFKKTTRRVGMHQQCRQDNFAQLLDITDDGRPELICGRVETYPERIYDTSTKVFRDLTSTVYQDALVPDVALADFDNDLKIDMLRLRGRLRPSEVKLVDADRLEAYLTVSSMSDAKGFRFSAPGPIQIAFADFERESVDSGAIFVGPGGWSPAALPFTLDPADAGNWGLPSHRPKAGIYIGLDPDSAEWVVEVSPGGENSRDAYIAIAGDGLSSPIPINFTNAEYPLPPSLVMDVGSGYERTYGFGIDSLWCKSVVAGDFDNDGDVDLFFACGGSVQNLPNRLFENQGDGTFVEVPAAGGAAGIQGVGLASGAGAADSVVVADYDSDGFLDLFVTNGILLTPIRTGGPDQLFRNQGNENHWIQLDLIGTASNRDGIGAKVYAHANHKTQLREQNGGYHRWSQNHTRLHFGLADATSVDLTVEWPSGQVDEITDLDVNRIYRVTEGGAIEPVVLGPVPGLPAPKTGDECGEPVFDRQRDQAMFLWKDCATNQWQLRVAAGGSEEIITYEGRFLSSAPFASVRGYSLEGGDVIDNSDPLRIAYRLSASATGVDGIDVTEGGAADCAGITWEAESGTVSGAFAVHSDPNASGGRYVGAIRGTRNRPNPKDGVTFTIEVPKGGTYRLDAVVQATSSKSDSFWVQVDDGAYWLYEAARTALDEYVTDAVNDAGTGPALMTLAPGQHRIRFLLRESGARLDKLALVPTRCTAATDAKTCFYSDAPAGAKLHLGSGRLPATLPLNLATLTAEGCPAARLSIGDATAIKDDSTRFTVLSEPAVAVADLTVDEGAGIANFQLTLAAASAEPISVDYATLDGSAVAERDYQGVGGTLTFTPGETAATISVPIIDNAHSEGDTQFLLELSNPINAVLTNATATATIIDDDELSACGAPTYNKASDPALFLWEDCDTGLWHLRAAAGGGRQVVTYQGTLSATQPFTEVTAFSFERNDRLAVTNGGIDFWLKVANDGQDGIDFRPAAGAEVCLDLATPGGATLLVGKGRAPAALPVDLATLGPCTAARP